MADKPNMRTQSPFSSPIDPDEAAKERHIAHVARTVVLRVLAQSTDVPWSKEYYLQFLKECADVERGRMK